MLFSVETVFRVSRHCGAAREPRPTQESHQGLGGIGSSYSGKVEKYCHGRGHSPTPFDNNDNISRYNLLVSSYHGFAQQGNEHVPVPQAFCPFPLFSLDFRGCNLIGGTDILMRFCLTLCGTSEFSRYRVLGKIQLEEPGMGRNLSKIRNFL